MSEPTSTTPNATPVAYYVDVEKAERLITLLESGEFTQGTGTLRRQETPEGPVLHCCLGVACEMFRRETGLGEWQVSKHHDARSVFVAYYDAEGRRYASETGLPLPVAEWFGFMATSPYGCLVNGWEGAFPNAYQRPRTAAEESFGYADSVAQVNDRSTDYRESIRALREVFMQPVRTHA